MNPRQWERLKELFHQALGESEKGRDELLTRLRAGEPELAAELERMLAQHESPSMELRSAPFGGLAGREEAPRFTEGEVAAGRFRILRFIGRGGMGEVYEAEDSQLRETVALKTIRTGMAGREAMIEGFRREIQMARRVTHPNVCRIHDIAEHRPEDGGAPVLLLTMEYLHGRTLSAQMREDGPMPAEVALPVIEQLAQGLAAAHAAGVMHGDFKPGNVMMVPLGGGGVKAVITDFGLARPLAAEAPVLAGTPEYAAPEVYRGGPASPAADVYSLGKTIGRAAQRPLEPKQAAAWERVLARCTERDPAKRWQDPREAARALRAALYPRRRWAGVGAAAGVTALLLAALWGTFRAPQPPAGVSDRKVADDPSERWTGNVTPDGKALAADDEFGNFGLYSLESRRFTALTRSRELRAKWFGGFLGGAGVAYSPDGRQVAYLWSDGKEKVDLRTLALKGGPEKTIATFQSIRGGLIYDWSPLGRVLLELVRSDRRCELKEIEMASARVIDHSAECPDNAVYAPDGRRILAQRTEANPKKNSDIVEVDLGSGAARPVVHHAANDRLLALTPDRRELLFLTDRRGDQGLWKVRVDGRGSPEPVELVAQVGRMSPLGLTAAGALTYRRLVPDMDVFLAAVDLNRGVIEPGGRRVMQEVLGGHDMPDWSPDGTRLTFRQLGGPNANRQAVLELASGEVTSTRCGSPWLLRGVQWDEGARLLRGPGADQNGQMGYFECDPATGVARMIAPLSVMESATEGQWSPDGRDFYNRFGQWTRGIYRWDRAGGEKQILYVPPEGTEIGQDDLAISPDGLWLVFKARQAAARRSSIMLLSTKGGAARPLFSVDHPALFPFWSFTWTPDSKGVLASVRRGEKGEVWQVFLDGREPRRLEAPGMPMRMLRLNRDGRTLAYVVGDARHEVWVLENFLR